MKNINYSWMMNESISYVVFKIPFFTLLDLHLGASVASGYICKIMVMYIQYLYLCIYWPSFLRIEILTTIGSCLVWQMEQLLNSWITRCVGSFEFAKIFHVTITMPLFNCNHNVELPLCRALVPTCLH